jgi:osmotically-inducible protein OsmY
MNDSRHGDHDLSFATQGEDLADHVFGVKPVQNNLRIAAAKR